jgi:hypothetical protein
LDGRISSPAVDANGTIVFLSPRKDGYAAVKNPVVRVKVIHTSEKKNYLPLQMAWGHGS